MKDMSIEVDQQEYAEEIAPCMMTRARSKEKTAMLNKEEAGEFRRILGALNWLSECCRADLAAEIAILQQTRSDARVCDLQMANTIVKRAKKFAAMRLHYSSELNVENSMILVCSDASWANNEDCYSQGGYMMMLTDRSMKKGEKSQCSPISW